MWILPTYNRPEQCAELLDRIIEHGGTQNPGLLFLNGGEKPYHLRLPEGWKLYYSPVNLGLCGALNKAFSLYPDEKFYGLVTDDEVIKASEWHKILPEAAGNWNIAHANDGWQSHHRIHGLTTFGGDLVRTIGYMAPEGLWHWYIDDFHEALAEACDLRVFCENVHIEHRHHIAGKSAYDKTYQIGESKAANDQVVFEEWKHRELPDLILKIKSRLVKERTAV